MRVILTLLFFSLGFSLSALEMFITDDNGELVYLNIEPTEATREIEDYARQLSLYSKEEQLTYFQGDICEKVAPESERLVAEGPSRNFHASMTAGEQADIYYIVTTLSDQPIAKLLLHKSSLDKAGDRILHVHPLNFLRYIFTHDELKVKVRNIRSKGWVWKNFIGGVKSTLKEEHARGNLLPEFYQSFAESIGIEIRKIEPYISKEKWDEFVNALVKHVASEGGNDRYNM